MPSDTLLSTSQLAAYLQVPEKTVANWRYRGGGPPAVKVGRHIRYRSVDVDGWLETLAEKFGVSA